MHLTGVGKPHRINNISKNCTVSQTHAFQTVFGWIQVVPGRFQAVQVYSVGLRWNQVVFRWFQVALALERMGFTYGTVFSSAMSPKFGSSDTVECRIFLDFCENNRAIGSDFEANC